MASQADESIAAGQTPTSAEPKSAVVNCVAKIPGHSASGSTGSTDSCDVNSNKKSSEKSARGETPPSSSGDKDTGSQGRTMGKNAPDESGEPGTGAGVVITVTNLEQTTEQSTQGSSQPPSEAGTVAEPGESPRGPASVTSTKDQSTAGNGGDSHVAISQIGDNKEIETPEGNQAMGTKAEHDERNPNDPREKIFEPWPSTSEKEKPKADQPPAKSNSTESEPRSPPPKQQQQAAAAAPPPKQPAQTGGTRLQIQPRTTQYEPHPLLQKEGLSELETLLAQRAEEKELTSKSNPNLGSSKEDPGAGAKKTNISRGKIRSQSLKLVPRSAHYERNALLDKSGGDFSELEKFLREKEKEVMLKRSKTLDEEPATMKKSSAGGATYAPRPLKLEPRLNQYERHALLEDKDESTGLSLLDIFLQEKEEEIDNKGKCSSKCTCKNAHCPNCKGESPRPSTAGSTEGGEARPDTRASSKRVTFQGQGEPAQEPSADGKKDSDNKGRQAGSDKNQPEETGADSNAQSQEAGQAKGSSRKGQKGKKSCTIS